jgi:multiple sugar transport system substrate-binding protein
MARHEIVPKASRRIFLRLAGLGALGAAATGLPAACGGTATTAVSAGSGGASTAATGTGGSAVSTSTAPTASTAATATATASPAVAASTGSATASGASTSTAATASPTTAAAAAANKAAVKLIFLTTDSAADGAALYKPVYDQFEQAQPDISVEWGTVALSDWPAYFEKITTMVASNSQLDIATIATEGMRLAAGNQFIIPLDPYLNRTTALQGYFQDVSPILEKVAVFGGKTYGLPADFNSRFIYLNLNRLKEEGLAVPPETWTFDDLRSYAQKLTRQSGGQTTQYGFQINVGRSFDADPYFFNFGVPGPLAGSAMDKPTMGDPNFPKVVQLLQDMIQKDGSSPAPGQKVSLDFTKGTLAMFSGNHGSALAYQKQQFTDFAVQFFPKGTTNVTEVGCNFWPIFSASKFKDQAWTFESFLLQPASIKALELRGANVAALRSVAYDPAFTTVPANNGKIWYECVDRPDFSVQSVIAPPDFNVLDGIWSKALTAMVSKNGDISGNIAELQKNLEAMIAQRPASWASL